MSRRFKVNDIAIDEMYMVRLDRPAHFLWSHEPDTLVELEIEGMANPISPIRIVSTDADSWRAILYPDRIGIRLNHKHIDRFVRVASDFDRLQAEHRPIYGAAFDFFYMCIDGLNAQGNQRILKKAGSRETLTVSILERTDSPTIFGSPVEIVSFLHKPARRTKRRGLTEMTFLCVPRKKLLPMRLTQEQPPNEQVATEFVDGKCRSVVGLEYELTKYAQKWFEELQEAGFR